MMSDDKAGRLERGHALIHWYNEFDEVDKDSPQDLIADVLHALHEQYGGEQTRDFLRLGQAHYEAEIEEENDG